MEIRQPKHLAHRLHLPLEFIQDLASRHSDHYHPFDKMIGKKLRHLFDPDNRLRVALVAIKELLQLEPLPDVFVGGVRRKTLRDFARPHIGHPWILKLDIKDFYPSVRYGRVYDLYHRKLGCAPDVARILTRLTTAEGHLPQGFNTSTVIGNLVLRDCGERLARLANTNDLHLTIWIDNIVFSGGDRLLELQPTIAGIIREYGFKLSENEPVPRTKAQTICGMTVNTHASYKRTKRKEIEAVIRAIRAGNICAVCSGDAMKLRRQIAARVGAVKVFNPRQHRKMDRRLDLALRAPSRRIDWTCRCGAKTTAARVNSTT